LPSELHPSYLTNFLLGFKFKHGLTSVRVKE
jgi:hypothetical protein